MKIAYIAAGAGGMYCGSCIRDNTLARELSRLGHPTLLIPTYTPLRTDEDGVAISRVFYGGIGVFLAQKIPLLRRSIPFLDRALSSAALIRLVTRLSISTQPAALGALAVSVLKGEQGNQRKSLEELLGYLEWEVRPDVVHLTNSVLAGLAAPLRRRLRVPVVASFQGEDLFLEGLPGPFRSEALGLIRAAASSIDAFTAVGGYTAAHMASLLGIPRERIAVVPPGLRFDGMSGARRRPVDPGRPFTVGYLARIAPEKGLSVLAEAFRILLNGLPAAPPQGLPRLQAAGFLDRAARPYLDGIRERLARWGLSGSFEYVGELDRPGKIRFLEGIDAFSVPATYPEAMGLSVLEAMACGAPAVLPPSGVFPEIIGTTGGGLLAESGDPASLAAGLRRLLLEPELRVDLGERAALGVRRSHTAEAMARATLAVYASVRGGSGT